MPVSKKTKTDENTALEAENAALRAEIDAMHAETAEPATPERTRTQKATVATAAELKARSLGVRLKTDARGFSLNRYTFRGGIYEGGYVYAPTPELRDQLVATGYFELIEIDDSYQRVDAVRRPRIKSAMETRKQAAASTTRDQGVVVAGHSGRVPV